MYEKKHTVCYGGECNLCLRKCRNLAKHKCPVERLNKEVGVLDKQPTKCDSCNSPFFSKKWINNWKSVDLCVNCSSIPEISNEKQFLRDIVHCHLIATNQKNCDICDLEIFVGNNLHCVNKFELDHKNTFTKSYAVGFMCLEGYGVETILEELAKCRVLCVSCHSVVTYVENVCGVGRCKQIQMSEEDQEQIQDHVNAQVRKLIASC